MTAETASPLAAEEVEIIARGLYWLASVDGIEDSEVALIEEFLVETASDWTIESIQEAGFDPRDLPVFLNTPDLRRTFLKAAVALIAVDGRVSYREQQALRYGARLLGLTDVGYAALEAEALELSLDDTK